MRKKAKRKAPSKPRTESRKAASGSKQTSSGTTKPKSRPGRTEIDELIQIWDEDLCE